MKIIDSTDIKHWADRNDCQNSLSDLLKKLIRETTQNISMIRFPSGDSANTSGWDGKLDSKEETDKIPMGISLWEWGVEKTIQQKANKEYSKRTLNSLGYEIKDSTFVFVTPRIWEENKGKNNKTNWIEEKKKEGKWKDIKIYDAIDLEDWIEKAPVTGLWLAKHIRKITPSGIQTARDFWEEWISNPKYKFTPEIVLSGRSSQLEELKEWLIGPPKEFILKAFTIEEALAFLCAAIESFEEYQKEYYYNKSLIVTNIESFRETSKVFKNLILINYFDDMSAVNHAIEKNGHHVFVPIGPDSVRLNQDSELQVLGRVKLLSELQSIGLSEDEASRYSKESGRSLSVLRRLLIKSVNKPQWARAENAKELIPALLAGRWDEPKDINIKIGDTEILSILSNKKYDEYINEIRKYKLTEDPLFYFIDSQWRLVSPIDAWFTITPYLVKNDLEKFEEVIGIVLREVNPEIELAEDKRYMASYYGKVRKYSNSLREGLLQTLILIGVYGEDKVTAINNSQEFVDRIVDGVMRNANFERWFSISDILPQLAEASPDSFLSNVEDSLNKEKIIMDLFKEGTDSFFSRCNHSGLLWALEGLAWDPKYLSRVSLILASLSRQDPGGKWANRPISTLRSIFLPWLPYTSANLEQRLIAIDLIIAKEPEIAIELLLKLLPQDHDIGHPTFKMRWRGASDWKESKVTFQEMYKTHAEILNRSLIIADNDGNLLSRILPSYDNFKLSEDRIKFYNHLKSKIDSRLINKNELKESLRTFISRHRSFHNAEWALPSDEIRKLHDLYELIPDGNIEEKFKWLFDDYFPPLLEGERKDHEKFSKNVEEERLKAVTEIVNFGGLEEVIALANKVKEPIHLGSSLGKMKNIDHAMEIKILNLFDKNKNLLNFARGYTYSRINSEGTSWIDGIINKLRSGNYNEDIIVNFLMTLESNMDTWKKVEKFNKTIEDKYWKNISGFFRNLSNEEYEYGFKKLISYERYLSALDSAGMNSKNVHSDLIIEILDKASSKKAVEPYKTGFDRYDVSTLFKELDSRNYSDENKMIELEWKYLKILSDEMSGRPPRLLHKDMSLNPASFVELIKMLYKPKDDEEMEKNETIDLNQSEIEIRSNYAWDLLKSWRTIPGTNDNGIVDYSNLKIWVDEAIRLGIQYKREYGCNTKIGEIFSRSIPENNLWPPEAICKIIDEYKNDQIDKGFFYGIINSRGMTTRRPFDGGQQERDIAKHYSELASKINSKYPFTTKILSDIAKYYEKEAKRMDDEAKKDELEY